MSIVDRILREYDGLIDVNEIRDEKFVKEKVVVADAAGSRPDTMVWPEEFLPYTKYLENKSEKNLEKIEMWMDTPLNYKPKKFARIFTQIDLDLIRNVTAEDLVTFDGSSESKSIQHIQNESKALITILSKEFNVKQLFGILKYAELYKNYNLIHIAIKALQSKKLNEKSIQRMLYYKNILDSQEGGIFPFAWILKDCEDSNLNVESEVASMRFCKIIERLKEMKNLTYEFQVREKYKQIIYSKMWTATNQVSKETSIYHKNLRNLYLTL